MKFLVTGAAGFIGFHLCKRLLIEKKEVVGIDNFNSYYDQSLKRARHKQLNQTASLTETNFSIIEGSIENNDLIQQTFFEQQPEIVINLAAQAGVRFSLENPYSYIQSNLAGFGNILENCRQNKVKHLIYASSSSVYGGNKKMPFKEKQGVDHPISLYAATKKANELMAHTYSHLFELPTTGLRFFTVYGPWGRPDMALFKFTKAILENNPIDIYNNGKMIRDFTYIDDIIESIMRLIKKPAKSNNKFNTLDPDPATSWAPYRVFNIGNSHPTQLLDYIEAIEKSINKKSIRNYLPIQPGDVEATLADTTLLNEWTGFKPYTSIQDGIDKFVQWYKDFYKY